MTIKYNEREIREAIKNSNSMVEACAKTSIKYGTFCSIARKLNIFFPNQSGKNVKDRKSYEQAMNCKWEELSKKRYKERVLHEQNGVCNICGCLPLWNNKPLKFQLDHICGKQAGDSRKNLQVICPNCHSQTHNFTSKNASLEGRKRMAEAGRKTQNLLKSRKL
mgnify:CR=1 FL=1